MLEHIPDRTLRIKQQNCKHSKDITLTLINMVNAKEWDLILTQELFNYPWLCLSPASPNWYMMYLLQDNNDDTIPCTLILISLQLTSHSFKQLQIRSSLITVLSLSHNNSDYINIDIYNIDNQLRHCPYTLATMAHVHQFLCTMGWGLQQIQPTMVWT